MTSTSQCRKCSAEIPAGLPAEFCAACLLAPAIDWWRSLPGIDEPQSLQTGDVLGPFVLGARLGEGTFGEIFVGSRREAGQPDVVAIKILKSGMDTREVLARFAGEREILGRLDHPHIVRILESGTTPQGRPWFAMELIEGDDLVSWCDEARLPLAGRLALFETVCRAVQHAHSRGLLHRDLKPGNVLIATDAEGAPQPKLIDFGLAKAVERDWSGDTAFTLFGRALGTPQYMAPEQAVPGSAEPDIRTDVYSLGVLLYELLTGGPPLSDERLRGATWGEIQRLIREVMPVAPSTRLARLGPATEDIATRRATTPEKLIAELRGELDWIVLRALEKEPARRYETAAALADDLERLRLGQEVLARAPSRRAALRRFVRRHRVAAGVILGFGALLILGTAVASFLALRAISAERLATDRLAEARKAQRSAAEAQDSVRAASAFIVEMLRSPIPGRRGGSVTVAECLDEAEAKVGVRFAGQPEIQLEVLHAIDDAKFRLSIGLRGEPISLRMVRVAEELSDPIRRAYWRNKAAALLQQRDRLTEAAQIFGETADRLFADGREMVPVRLVALRGLGLCVQPRDPHRAAAIFAEHYQLCRDRNGPSSPSAIGSLAEEGWSLFLAEFPELARARLQRAQDLAAGAAQPILRARIANYLARVLLDQRKPSAALAQTTAALHFLAGRGDPPSWDRTQLLSLHAELLAGQDRHEEAIAVCQREIDSLKRKLKPDAIELLYARERWIKALRRAGRGEQALREVEALLVQREEKLGFGSLSTTRTVLEKARILDLLGRPGEAVALLRQAVVRRREDQTDEGRYTNYLLEELGDRLLVRGDPVEAVSVFRERYLLRRSDFGAGDPRTMAAQSELGEALMSAGQWAEAEKHLTESLRNLPSIVALTDQRVTAARQRLVKFLRAREREPEARALLAEAEQELRSFVGDEHPATRRAAALLTGQQLLPPPRIDPVEVEK